MGSILSELPSTPTACQRGLGDTPDTRTPFWAQVLAVLCNFAIACLAYHFLSQGIPLPKLATGKAVA